MGLCESNSNSKKLFNENMQEESSKNNNTSNIMPLYSNIKDEKVSNLSKKFSEGKNQYSTRKSDLKINLETYEPSLAKTSELSNSKLCKEGSISKFSKSNEEEIIIRGEVNVECKIKENDFDYSSFKKLVQNNGGVFMKDENQYSNNYKKQKENTILCDFEKDEISEIKSELSLDEYSNSNNNNLFDEINGKNVKIEYNKYENSSKYSTNTTKPKINLNKYFNGIFSNEYNYNIHNTKNINIRTNINNPIYNTQVFKPYININNRYQNPLLNNYDNKSNTITNKKLSGSIISVPKQKGKNIEYFTY